MWGDNEEERTMANDPPAEASRQLTAALKGARGRLLSLLLGALALLPPPAIADEIPFLVTQRGVRRLRFLIIRDTQPTSG